MRLSLRLDSEAALDVSPDNRLRPGMVVSGEVTGVSESGLSVCYTKTGEIGYLPTQHLSDNPAFCVRVLSQHQHSLEAAVKEGMSHTTHKHGSIICMYHIFYLLELHVVEIRTV